MNKNFLYYLSAEISQHNLEINKQYGTNRTVLIPEIMCQLYDHPAMKQYFEEKEPNNDE